MKTKNYFYLPLIAVAAQMSYGQLTEIYNAGTGNWEVDSQNASPMKNVSDDSTVNLYPLDGDYTNYKIIVDSRSYESVVFGGNGDRTVGGASNGYIIGALQVSDTTGVSRMVKVNIENTEYSPITVLGDVIIKNNIKNDSGGAIVVGPYFKSFDINGTLAIEDNSSSVDIWNLQSIGAVSIKNNSNGNISLNSRDKNTYSYTIGALNIEGNTNQIRVGNAKDLTIESVTFKNNTSDYTWVGSDTNGKLTITGGVSALGSGVGVLGADNAAGAKKASVGGNIVISSDAGQRTVFGTAIGAGGTKDNIGSFDNADIYVEGVVDMSQGSGTKIWKYNFSNWDALHSYISIEGLKGGGKLVTNNINWANGGNTRDNHTIIAFRAKSGQTYEFEGHISSMGEGIDTANENKLNKQHLDLEMRGEAGGTQILKVTKDGNTFFDSNITVYGGTLRFSNTNDIRAQNPEAPDQKFNQLILEGGEFGAIDNAYFSDVIWNGGDIVVGFDGSNFDKITAETLLLGSADFYKFVFDVNGEDMDGRSFNISEILNIADGITESQLAKFSGRTSDGLYDVVFANGQFSFAAVPEPAAIAAMLGALALAFAACRRRR